MLEDCITNRSRLPELPKTLTFLTPASSCGNGFSSVWIKIKGHMVVPDEGFAATLIVTKKLPKILRQIKIISSGILDPQKGMKNTRNWNYIDKHKDAFLVIWKFKNTINLLKQNNISWSLNLCKSNIEKWIISLCTSQEQLEIKMCLCVYIFVCIHTHTDILISFYT